MHFVVAFILEKVMPQKQVKRYSCWEMEELARRIDVIIGMIPKKHPNRATIVTSLVQRKNSLPFSPASSIRSKRAEVTATLNRFFPKGDESDLAKEIAGVMLADYVVPSK